VVARKELAPGAVAELGRLGRRVDDVGEKNRGENALGLTLLPTSSRPDLGENCSISAATRAAPERPNARCPIPGISTRRAVGICEATCRATSTGMMVSSAPWSTNVGTRTVGKTCRTSIS
jgi:hypothetical protein